jgi:hypothetical protein
VHPVDRLAEIRGEIARLHAEAEAIYYRVASGEVGTRGDDYQAHVRKQLLLRRIATNCEELS